MNGRLLLTAFLFAACIGGTGTDTENGLTETRNSDLNGAPLVGISLRVLPADFRPDKDSPAGNLRSPEGIPVETVTADSRGEARFKLADTGTYVVEGFNASGTLYFDTLRVKDISATLKLEFKAQAAQLFAGKIRLQSGYVLDSAVLFIRGTGYWQRLDSSGNYDLGQLPVQATGMGVGIRYQALPPPENIPTSGPNVTDTTSVPGPKSFTGSRQCIESGPTERETFQLQVSDEGLLVDDIADRQECVTPKPDPATP